MFVSRWSATVLVFAMASRASAAHGQAAPQQDPATVAARFVAAYNAHDLEGVLATYSDTLKGFALGEPTPVVTGKAAMQTNLAAVLYVGSAAHLDILHRSVQGPFVILEFRATGLASDGTAKPEATILEVAGGRIIRFWLLAKPVPRPELPDR